MAALNVVLVNPEIPQNTGNIARTCALTGAKLHLVEPLGFRTDDRSLKRAGLDYWHLLNVTVYHSLSDFFARNAGNCYYFSARGSRTYSDISYPDGCFLVFGKESSGLPEELLRQNAERCMRIPMRGVPGARSLNLSSAAAVGVYEVLRQWDYPELLRDGRFRSP